MLFFICFDFFIVAKFKHILLIYANHPWLYGCRQYACVLYYLLSDKACQEAIESLGQTTYRTGASDIDAAM